MPAIADQATMRNAIYQDPEILAEYQKDTPEGDTATLNLLNTKTYQQVQQFRDPETGSTEAPPGSGLFMAAGQWNDDAMAAWFPNNEGYPSGGHFIDTIDKYIATLEANDQFEKAASYRSQLATFTRTGFNFTRNGVITRITEIFGAQAQEYLELGYYDEIVAENQSRIIEGTARLAVQQDINDARDVDYRIELDGLVNNSSPISSGVERDAWNGWLTRKNAMYETGPRWGPNGIRTAWADAMEDALTQAAARRNS